VRGKYPTRNYPKVFQDPTVGEQAKKVFEEANELLKKIIKQKLLRAKAIFGIYPANSVGEDIEVYSDNIRSKTLATFHGLRQQEEKPNDGVPFVSLGDYVYPKHVGGAATGTTTDVVDYVGFFVVSTGFGADELVKKYKAENDDYNAIMVQALADRLAEALAEKLHEDVRKKYWGYSQDEDLTVDDLIKVKYRGRRPAPGYPTQPDHTEKLTMWKLLNVKESIGCELTESLAMYPAASVSGIYFANPHTEYFAVGRVGRDQVADYARRKGITIEKAEDCLSPILSYDPQEKNQQ